MYRQYSPFLLFVVLFRVGSTFEATTIFTGAPFVVLEVDCVTDLAKTSEYVGRIGRTSATILGRRNALLPNFENKFDDGECCVCCEEC